MSNGLATVAGGLVGLAAMGALAAARARRGRPYLADGLSSRVDGPADPVATAVRAGFAGVEVGRAPRRGRTGRRSCGWTA